MGTPGKVRHLWLDLARGLAIISMLVAHTAPVGGIFNVTEYLTAPLFAAMIAASLHYAFEMWRGGTGRFVAAMSLRGAVLFLGGVALQPLYLQIVVVLQWLGALTVVAAIVVALRLPSWILGVAGALIVAVSPPLMMAARSWRLSDPSHVAGPLVDFLIAAPYYRLIPMIAAALLGVLLARWLARPVRRRILATVAAGAVAAVAVAVGKVTPLGADPYSGTWPDLVACLALVVAASAASSWVATTSSTGWLAPLVATGQLAMTAYVLQSVLLRILTETVLQGQRDDHWWVLGFLIVTIVALCWAWQRFLGQGPFERVLRLPVRLLRPAS